jgi:hypothetical protein
MIIYAMHCSLMLVSHSHLLLISIQNMYVQGKLKHVVEENLLNILFTGINLLNVIPMDCSYAILGIASKTVIFCAFLYLCRSSLLIKSNIYKLQN